MGCLPWLKSPICPGFETRDFSSPTMTAGNAIELILPGALVLSTRYPRLSPSPASLKQFCHLKATSWAWLLEAICCASPSGIFCRYRTVIFLNHPGVSSPLEPYCYYYIIIITIIITIIIIIIIIIITVIGIINIYYYYYYYSEFYNLSH